MRPIQQQRSNLKKKEKIMPHTDFYVGMETLRQMYWKEIWQKNSFQILWIALRFDGETDNFNVENILYAIPNATHRKFTKIIC